MASAIAFLLQLVLLLLVKLLRSRDGMVAIGCEVYGQVYWREIIEALGLHA